MIRVALTLAAVVLTTACSPQALIGLAASTAGMQIVEQNVRAAVKARGGNAAQEQCAVDKVKATVKPEDLAGAASSGESSSSKVSTAISTAIEGCLGTK